MQNQICFIFINFTKEKLTLDKDLLIRNQEYRLKIKGILNFSFDSFYNLIFYHQRKGHYYFIYLNSDNITTFCYKHKIK